MDNSLAPVDELDHAQRSGHILLGMTRIPGSARLRLNPESPMLHRRNGDLQFGWDPETAVVVHTGSSADRRAVLALIRMLDGTVSTAVATRRVVEAGLPPDRASQLIAELVDSGHLLAESVGISGSVRVHGNGPLADAITAQLANTSLTITRSRELRSLSDVRRWSCDLVVLADTLVWDPAFIHKLMLAGLDHLVVRTRDGKGIVGPLVIPGVTSCTHCADLTRSTYDPEWPWLAAQLLGRNGTSSPINQSATTSFTIAEICRQVQGQTGRPATTINSTVEIDTRRLETGRRHWPVQPECGCQNLHKPPVSGGIAMS